LPVELANDHRVVVCHDRMLCGYFAPRTVVVDRLGPGQNASLT
jgi:hypothetical protein